MQQAAVGHYAHGLSNFQDVSPSLLFWNSHHLVCQHLSLQCQGIMSYHTGPQRNLYSTGSQLLAGHPFINLYSARHIMLQVSAIWCLFCACVIMGVALETCFPKTTCRMCSDLLCRHFHLL